MGEINRCNRVAFIGDLPIRGKIGVNTRPHIHIPSGALQMIPFYSATPYPPSPVIQDAARLAMRAMSINEGYLNQYGVAVVPYDAEGELPPSVARVVKWLDQYIDGQITIECAALIGMPHRQQLRIAVQDLHDHGLVEIVVHNGVQVFYLTDLGDELAEDIIDMELPELPTRNETELGGLFGYLIDSDNQVITIKEKEYEDE